MTPGIVCHVALDGLTCRLGRPAHCDRMACHVAWDRLPCRLACRGDRGLIACRSIPSGETVRHESPDRPLWPAIPCGSSRDAASPALPTHVKWMVATHVEWRPERPGTS